MNLHCKHKDAQRYFLHTEIKNSWKGIGKLTFHIIMKFKRTY